MRFTAYYLVRGKAALIRLAEKDDDLAVLVEPFLISSQEGGLRNPTSKSEYISRAEIFALLHFSNEYFLGVKKLFENKNLGEEFFDEWWELIPAGDIESMPTFGERYKVANVSSDAVTTTSAAVQDWLNRVVDF